MQKAMPIEVTYRRTHRLSMRIVKNGDVHVSAPIGMPRYLVEQFIAEHRDWIEQARQRTQASQQQRADFYGQLPLTTRQQRQQAVSRLDAIVLPLVRHYAQLMGVQPTKVCYRATVSRWGACNVRTSAITFSIYLLLLPQWCIEHVVVHELPHLLEPSPNARFHALMDRYFPRWREARAETRRISRTKQ